MASAWHGYPGIYWEVTLVGHFLRVSLVVIDSVMADAGGWPGRRDFVAPVRGPGKAPGAENDFNSCSCNFVAQRKTWLYWILLKHASNYVLKLSLQKELKTAQGIGYPQNIWPIVVQHMMRGPHSHSPSNKLHTLLITTSPLEVIEFWEVHVNCPVIEGPS